MSNQHGSCDICLHLIWEATPYHFCWAHRPALVQWERGLDKAGDTNVKDHWRPSQKMAVTATRRMFGSPILFLKIYACVCIP